MYIVKKNSIERSTSLINDGSIRGDALTEKFEHLHIFKAESFVDEDNKIVYDVSRKYDTDLE